MGVKSGWPSLDRRLRLVANEHRHRCLFALQERGRLDESDLHEVLAGDDADLDLALVQTYHHHLPMLADSGVIEWRPDDGVVERGDLFDSVVPLLECLESNEEKLLGESR